MKANELRIGNWAFKEVGITALKPIQIDLFRITEHYYRDRYKPIPLTEEWLVKFGNKKNKNDNNYWDILGCFYKKVGNVFVCSDESDYPLPDLEFVHTYQNLVFALTGEELQ